MASTYSSNLKIELMNTGENSGTWGTITNTNLGTALEQAVVGYGNPDFTSDANLTISITDSNAAQAARALVLNVTSAFGSLTVTRELIVPTSQKQYIVQNNTTGGQSITVKTSGGTGITVPNGRKAHLYVNGTNVIQMFDFVDINGGAIDGTTVGAASASTGSFTTLATSGALTYGGVTLSNSVTGTGSMVLATSPTLTTPALGTPSALVGTNITGTAAGLTAGNVTTNANLTGAVTSTGNATSLGSFTSAQLAGALTDETGSGSAVFATSPTLVTPALGTPASGVVTNLTGTASININGTVGATTANTGAFTTLTASTNLSSTRIDPRVSSAASTATLTPDIASFDQYNLTAQAAGLTIAAPTGTPVDGNKLIIRILDNGTARALTWNATYTVIGTTLPTTTVINKTTYVGCIYNANNTRWDVIAVTTQA
jgi:hypothetical protein